MLYTDSARPVTGLSGSTKKGVYRLSIRKGVVSNKKADTHSEIVFRFRYESVSK